MFLIIVSTLYLGEKELSQEHVMEAVQLLYERYQFENRSLALDRLFLAFLCRLVAKTPLENRTEIWQQVYQITMKILDRFLTSDSSRDFEHLEYPMKHHKLICGAFLWVFDDWNSYIQAALQGLELPPEIAGKLIEEAQNPE
jgi:hypothetical protein